LHLESHFEGLDARLELRVLLERLGVHVIELVHEIELPALAIFGSELVADVQEHFAQRHLRRVIHVAALVESREEGGLPPLGLAAEGDESGHVLVLRAESINRPRTHAGLGQLEGAGVHEALGDFVRRDIRPQRADDRHVVHHLAQFGKTSLTSMPDLPILLNLKGEGKARPSRPGRVLSAYLANSGLGSQVSTCEGPPSAKDVDHRFGLRRSGFIEWQGCGVTTREPPKD
jgi:hypothetical protein